MIKNFQNTVTLQIIHGTVLSLLNRCIEGGITMRQVEFIDEITAIITIDQSALSYLQKTVRDSNGEIRMLRYQGISQKLYKLRHRSVLLLGILFFLLLSVGLQRKILIVSVEGNYNVPANLILEAAETAGVYIGASRREIQSESVKNMLLQLIPQLKWIGVNTHGCIARITVEEDSTEEQTSKIPNHSGIFAIRDGIIRSVNVTKGSPLCVSGQAVKAGDLLISSYTDCGSVIHVTGAEGEVYAETLRNVEVVIPIIHSLEGEISKEILNCTLRIGKKRINLFKGSGIYDTTCDKMYKEYYMTLPGGFRLPIALEVEQLRFYSSGSILSSSPMTNEELENLGANYLRQEMIAGYILSSNMDVTAEKDHFRLSGSYHCIEMIGRVQQEETALRYGKID